MRLRLNGVAMRRWPAVGVALLTACGGQSPFDFEGTAYPGIVVLPLAAYLDHRLVDVDDETASEHSILESVRDAAVTSVDTPFISDWDLMLGRAADGLADNRDLQRYYMAHLGTAPPLLAGCTVELHVFEGLPYDPSRAERTTVSASVDFDTEHRDGFTIQTGEDCMDEAGYRVVESLVAAGLFAPGWSMGPPAHDGG